MVIIVLHMAEQIPSAEIVDGVGSQQGAPELILPSVESVEQGSSLYLYVIGLAVLIIVIIAFLRRKSKPSKK